MKKYKASIGCCSSSMNSFSKMFMCNKMYKICDSIKCRDVKYHKINVITDDIKRKIQQCREII